MDSIRIYDNEGTTADRFTVIFMDRPERQADTYACVAMDSTPFHPLGFGQHSTAMPGLHLGKRIRFANLPSDCQKLVLRDIEDGPKQLYPEDYDKTGDDLELKYSPEGGGEHPYYDRSEWVSEVNNENTISGYWDWLASMLESEKNDNEELLDAGVSDPDDQDDPLDDPGQGCVGDETPRG